MKKSLLNILYLGNAHIETIKTVCEKSGAGWQVQQTDQIDTLAKLARIGVLIIDWPLATAQQPALVGLAGDKNLAIIAIADPAQEPSNDSSFLFDYLLTPLSPFRLARTLQNAFSHVQMNAELQNLQARLDLQSRELHELNEIGIALSSEHDIQVLLKMILQKSREITGADAGSLYLVEKIKPEVESEPGDFSNKQLRFKLSHNDSLALSYNEFVMPIEKRSMAGYAAITGEPVNIEDVYQIAPDSEFQHNRSFDQKTGYRTKSVLSIPMRTHKGEIIAVLQLLNRKKDWQAKLTTPEIVASQVLPFDQRCVSLACSMASQAAVSIENTRLYEEITHLFEGFIRASVHAIEQRDPTTSGHSERVAVLTVGLAEKIDQINSGIFKEIKFSRDDLKQIKYAGLLHDFGKIGVREEVLVKAKKLYPHQLEMIKLRFKFIRKATELNFSRRKLEFLLRQKADEAQSIMQTVDREFENELKRLDEYLDFILQTNEPTVLEKTGFDKLLQISQISFPENGLYQPYLKEDEVDLLSISRGTLNTEERKEIESHVKHTFNFLMRIPWTAELKQVPIIAYSHHEKLDGTGYPRRLKLPDIPIQSRMMAISDIYDALTAWDRPYKKAVPIEKALDILNSEVKSGKLDRDLYNIFIEAEIYKLVRRPNDEYPYSF